jgi:hypothetical protein
MKYWYQNHLWMPREILYLDYICYRGGSELMRTLDLS